MLNVEPLLDRVMFLHQIPTTYELIGSAVVVVGLLYYNYHTALAERENK